MMLAEWIKGAGDLSIDSALFQRAVEIRVVALQSQADRLIDNFIRGCMTRASA